MAYPMWTRMVPVAGQQAQRAWEVQPVRENPGEARLPHPDQAVPIETLTIQSTGLVNIAPLPTSGQPPSVRCASNGDKSLVLCKSPNSGCLCFFSLLVNCGGELP